MFLFLFQMTYENQENKVHSITSAYMRSVHTMNQLLKPILAITC